MAVFNSEYVALPCSTVFSAGCGEFRATLPMLPEVRGRVGEGEDDGALLRRSLPGDDRCLCGDRLLLFRAGDSSKRRPCSTRGVDEFHAGRGCLGGDGEPPARSLLVTAVCRRDRELRNVQG